ncbi:MAG: hypothetical protein ABI472_08445, partial [Ginsengibacter sp.]
MIIQGCQTIKKSNLGPCLITQQLTGSITASKSGANDKGFQSLSLETLPIKWAHLGSNQGPPDYES